MFAILIAVAIIATIIYCLVYVEDSFKDKILFCGICLMLSVLLYFGICGLGGLIAGAVADPVAIETNTYYFTDTDDQYLVTATNDNSLYFNYTINNPHPVKQRVLVKNTFVSKPEENELPHIIEYKYDFASSALRFIFWNPYDSIYEFVIDKSQINWNILN